MYTSVVPIVFLCIVQTTIVRPYEIFVPNSTQKKNSLESKGTEIADNKKSDDRRWKERGQRTEEYSIAMTL